MGSAMIFVWLQIPNVSKKQPGFFARTLLPPHLMLCWVRCQQGVEPFRRAMRTAACNVI